MNRDEILQAVAEAAADYREATGDSTEDLSLALALAELEPPDASDGPCTSAEPSEELRADMLRALCVDHGHDRREGGMNCRTCKRRVDALITLPVVAILLADHERVARVRAISDSCTLAVDDTLDRIRRALEMKA